jgi:hypothetical protein
MFDWFEMAVMAAAIASGAWAARFQRPARRRGWRDAALACGLTDVEGSDPLTARAGPLLVRIAHDQEAEGSLRPAVLISIQGGEDDLVPVTVRETGRATAFQHKTAVPSGDPFFDDAVVVSGPSLVVQASLDEQTRALLGALVAVLALRFDFGALKARLPEPWISGELASQEMANALRRLLDAARRLRPPPDLSTVIAHNARHDCVAAVRERNLVALATSFPGAPLTVETLHAATSDASDAVRVRAAVLLGGEGRSTLMEVATREGAEDGPAADAVRALGQWLPLPQAESVLGGALRRRRSRTALACLETLAGTHAPQAVAVLARVLAVETGESAAAAAGALAETRVPAAETPLVEALARDDALLRVTAAQALGQIGTAAAVLPLQEAEARSADAALRRASRLAVAAIQSRLHGASPGQLSLASGAAQEGKLSLAEDADGRLSLGPGSDSAAAPAAPPDTVPRRPDR